MHSLLYRFVDSYKFFSKKTKYETKLTKILLGNFQILSLALYLITKYSYRDKILIKNNFVKKLFTENILFIFNPTFVIYKLLIILKNQVKLFTNKPQNY